MTDSSQTRPVLVIDFGAQYAQLIARRVREAKVYSEVVPHTATVDELAAKNPAAVVLSGGPSSVYADGAPQLDPRIFDLDVPVFGICYGFQAMAQALGGYPDATAATCRGADRYGLDLQVHTPRGVANTRVGYRQPINDPAELRSATVELARRARS